MPKFNPPENFNFHNTAGWPAWKQRFTRFRIASKLNKEEGDVQVSSLIYSMGPEAEQIFSTFIFNADGDDTKYDVVMDKFDSHFVPRRNTIHERSTFNKSEQQPGQSVEAFVRALHEQAILCDFGDQKNDLIRDRLVVGLLDKEIGLELQLLKKLTLEEAIEKARNSEMVKGQVKFVDEVHHYRPTTRGRGRGRGAPHVSRSGHRGGHRGGQRGSHRGSGQSYGTKSNCGNCGKPTHKDKSNCPARNDKCHKCQKVGHWSRLCRSVDEVFFEEDFFVGSITTCQDGSVSYKVTLPVCGTHVKFKVDTGADATVMPVEVYYSLPEKPILHPATTRLNTFGGQLSCKGTFEASTVYKSKRYTFTVYVITNQGSCVLSRGASLQMGMVKFIQEIESSEAQDVGLLQGEPVKINLKEGIEPFCLSTARRIPIPLLPKVTEELHRMESAGVIEKVTKPTEWCAPMVPVLKKSGKIRICVDLKRLNRAVKRELYQLPTLEDVTSSLTGSTIFSLLDAESGFWQVPLTQQSSELTTFITPIGRYCFKRLPFGISSAPEIFQRKMVELLHGLEGVRCYMDDILVHGKDMAEHDHRLSKVMDRVKSAGLRLNNSKCVLRQPKLDFLGQVISSDGMEPSPAKVAAIKDMEEPTNVTELRRVLGMINYLGRYLPDLSTLLHPLNKLLGNDIAWTWGPAQVKAYLKVKDLISTAPILTHYDVSKPTVVSADASSYGMGGILMQQHIDGLKPVAFCSRTLTTAETKYAQIEKECLAGVWACERFDRYLQGLESFRLLTDHKPLVPLINTKQLDQVPIRCQRLLMRMMRYNPTAEHVAGKTLVVADALSRSPLKITDDKQVDDINEDITATIDMLLSSHASPTKLSEIRLATWEDQLLQRVVHFTKYGWPQHIKDVDESLRDYFQVQNNLSEIEGLLVFGERIVMPNIMRIEMLEKLHAGHLGINKCKQRSETAIWWPGIARDIVQYVSRCQFCQVKRPSQHSEPLKPTILPDRPWQQIGADLCEVQGRKYLVVIDYFSRWLEICEMSSTTGSQVVNKLKTLFARFGIPEILKSDNGPQFACASMKSFSQECDFSHITSSPHLPQSNGEAEAGVKIAKHIVSQLDPFQALLNYRATPISATGSSPAQLIMGRNIRTTLPQLKKNLDPKWPDLNKVREQDKKMKESYACQYNKRQGVKQLPELYPGDNVITKLDDGKLWRPATVIARCDTPRSYIIDSDSQGMIRRNRKHIQPYLPENVHTEHVEDSPIPTRTQTPIPPTLDVPATPTKPPDVASQKTLVQAPRRSDRHCKAPDKLGDWIEVIQSG